MAQGLSDKKKFEKIPYIVDKQINSLPGHVKSYGNSFVVYTFNNQHMAYHYAVNLLRCQKDHTNMERMVEHGNEEIAYHQYHQFLSESKWDYVEVNNKTALHANNLMLKCKAKSGSPTGLIIDESAHLKKGKMSVGVGRQYAGVAGKVDNCQVSVYASLCNEDITTIIDSVLFLPQDWIDDKKRCEKSGIPKEHISFKTKPQLALEIIKAKVKLGVEFDWIGGDGLYGHNSDLTNGLDDEGLFYVLDCHKSETVFMSEPSFSIPEKKGKRGRNPTAVKPDIEAVKLETYCQSLALTDWEEVTIRKTAKGWKKVNVHIAQVWHWDGVETKARKRTLVITKTKEQNPKVKYSFSNGSTEDYSAKEYAYFQCNRYWVERSFDDAKNELGLSGYQVRKWTAWHHHQALVLMACVYLQQVKFENKQEYELMSVRDTRILIIAHLFTDPNTTNKLYKQMNIRHYARQKDIDRHYEKPEY